MVVYLLDKQVVLKQLVVLQAHHDSVFKKVLKHSNRLLWQKCGSGLWPSWFCFLIAFIHWQLWLQFFAVGHIAKHLFVSENNRRWCNWDKKRAATVMHTRIVLPPVIRSDTECICFVATNQPLVLFARHLPHSLGHANCAVPTGESTKLLFLSWAI